MKKKTIKIKTNVFFCSHKYQTWSEKNLSCFSILGKNKDLLTLYCNIVKFEEKRTNKTLENKETQSYD